MGKYDSWNTRFQFRFKSDLVCTLFNFSTQKAYFSECEALDILFLNSILSLLFFVYFNQHVDQGNSQMLTSLLVSRARLAHIKLKRQPLEMDGEMIALHVQMTDLILLPQAPQLLTCA